MKVDVKYSGRDVDRGRMGVLELGPAMIGVGQMIGEASRILYGDSTRVRVEVDAKFRQASFGIEFFAVTPNVLDLAGSLTLDQIEQIGRLIGMVAAGSYAGTKGLIGLVRWQRGRRIQKIQQSGDEVVITAADGESTTATIHEYRIFIDDEARKGLRALVAPLESEGVEALQIGAGDAPPVVIPREERASFLSAPMPEQEVAFDQYTTTLEVVSPTFKAGNKWRVAHGGSAFYIEMADTAFIDKVAKREVAFASGDALRCRIEQRTTKGPDGFTFEQRIVEVLQHIGADSNELPPLL
jgi:hypothetical protein